MKHFSRILAIVSISIFVLALSVNPLILFVAREQLKARLPGSNAAISGCQFNFFHRIIFNGIQVSKVPVYDLQIKSLTIGFSPASMLKAFRGDIMGAIESCEIIVDYLELNKTRLAGGYLKVSRTNDNGEISCSEFTYEKLKVLGIKGKTRLKDDYLYFDSLSGQLLGGIFQGDSLIKLDSNLGYQLRVDFTNLDLDTFMKDFALDEKAEVSGKVNGFLELQGDNQGLEVLEGNLGSGKEGGVLTIKDTQFLQNMARSSGQALDLVVESFKNYRYNTNKTTLSLEDNNIVFLVNLDGSAGKRSLNITLHNFNPGRIK
ncbi:MAG: YdbH domain-containing protein [Candidatus Omnitrophica bacterium]|nr:YdbH domain-containing protein [Candidatus Omnitrophota bacterium]